jgi:regulator of replication initiation timing
MDDAAEIAAVRLWRDRLEIREHERNEARAQVRVAQQKLEILTAENDRLAVENSRLRDELARLKGHTGADTAMQMEAIRCALAPMLG